jgi:hypothetical protein
MGDPRGVDALRAVLRALRADGRGLAVELVGALHLTELRAELERLARRPRGVDAQSVARALRQLSDAPLPPTAPAASAPPSAAGDGGYHGAPLLSIPSSRHDAR